VSFRYNLLPKAIFGFEYYHLGINKEKKCGGNFIFGFLGFGEVSNI